METGEDTDKRMKRKRKISVIESDDEENHEIKGIVYIIIHNCEVYN